MDDSSNDSGTIAGGWCLNVTTGEPQNGQFQFGLTGYTANAGSSASIAVNRTNGSAGTASVDVSAADGAPARRVTRSAERSKRSDSRAMPAKADWVSGRIATFG